MAARSNAASELTRFWLQDRHGYLVREAVPVPLVINGGHNSSDIDLVARTPSDAGDLAVPGGVQLGPRVIVETKDEHNWDQSIFQSKLLHDVELMGMWPYIPKGTPDVKLSMLRQEHYDVAANIFATNDFDRLFVVHALDPLVRAQIGPALAQHRIYWLTLPELVADLVPWLKAHPKPAALRHTLIGDLLVLLVGHCQLGAPAPKL